MSFLSDVKSELCRLSVSRKCCAVAEAYGVLLYCNTFSYKSIRIITESRPFAARLEKLWERAFGFNFDRLPDYAAPGKLTLLIEDSAKIDKVFETYGYSTGKILALHINLGVLEKECCQSAFVRGAFLAGGSVTDPEKHYHLELVTPHYNVSRETFSILLDMEFSPKETVRNSNYVTYFKQSEYIEDFLTKIGAPVSAMQIMSAKVEKELRNSVNRRVNCDTANLSKAVDAAQQQLEAIRRLAAAGKLDGLPGKLRHTARMRMENPEATLTELAAALSPPVTKSCLNHRLRRIIELSRE